MGRFLGFLFALNFIFPLATFAAVPGNAPVICIAAPGLNTQSLCIPVSCLAAGGGSGSGCPGQIFSLYGATTGAVSANFYHPLFGGPLGAGTSAGPGVPYRVTTGKTAYCINPTAQSNTASNYLQLVAGTGVFTIGGTGTAPTGTVWQNGATSSYAWSTGPTSATTIPLPGSYTFSSLYYAGFQNQAASVAYQVHLDCFEL